jgi:hypothetical protein
MANDISTEISISEFHSKNPQPIGYKDERFRTMHDKQLSNSNLKKMLNVLIRTLERKLVLIATTKDGR